MSDSEPTTAFISDLIDSINTHVSYFCANRPQGLAELEQVESEIVALLKKVQRLKNSTRLINQLPPELLASIFDFCRPQLPGIFEQSVPPDNTMSKLISTCSHWRQVGLEFPNLWTDIDTADGNNARRHLKRSGSAPLNVAIRTPWKSSSILSGSGNDAVCQHLANHNSRLRELHVLSNPVYPEHLGGIEYFNTPAPLLRRLSLSAHWTFRGTLPVIFNGHFPQLDEIILDGISKWTGNSFRNITRLSLSGQSYEEPLTKDLYDLLDASPSLSQLYLSFQRRPPRALDVHFEIDHTLPPRPIVLSRLQTLHIVAGCASQLAPLVSRLVLPQGVEVCIYNIFMELNRPKEFQDLFCDNLGGLHNFSKLRIECEGMGALKVCGISGTTVFNFQIEWRATSEQIHQSLDHLFSLIAGSPMIELQLKRFDTLLVMGSLNWSNNMRIPSLETLVLIDNGHVSENIVLGLFPFTDSSGEVEVPCPQLTVLEILCPNMRSGSIPSLASAITQRKANFCSLRILRLSQAHLGITVDDMAQMRNDVTVDVVPDLVETPLRGFQEPEVFMSLGPQNW